MGGLLEGLNIRAIKLFSRNKRAYIGPEYGAHLNCLINNFYTGRVVREIRGNVKIEGS